ncbi:MAG TPA: amidase family protein [Pyrinomonadaceae bacterium]|nr:amidase family protein [Pyrinomonadaceae bacterium]
MKKISLFLIVAIAVFSQPVHSQRPFGAPSSLQLVEASVPELQLALRSRLITSEQLVQMYLNRIAAYDDAGPLLNSFIHINANALDEARARDRDRDHGRAHGPLFGIPVLLKDNIDTVDMPTTAGSVALAGSIPPNDAFITEKLREAGAIILGKATLTEFANFIAIGMPSGYSSLGGYGFNAYDPRPLPASDGRPVLTPGGSSSGSGIAVSANLVAVAIGTETSGSILSPGSSNGIVGIKPTVGLVSRSGILPITADQDTAGPLARTVTDAAILLGQIAGHDPNDPATAACLINENCHSDYTKFLKKHALRGARIAVPRVPYWIGFTPAQQQIMLDAIAALRAEGAFVDDPHEIPNQAAISAFGICVTFPAPSNCSTVLMYGQKHDLNNYLATRPNAPVHTLSDIIAFNNANAAVALKYGQAIFLAANQLDTSPGSADTQRYLADRALDLALTRTGLDAVLNGPDGLQGTEDDFDAILFPQNRGAGAPAKAGYPSIVVPGGFMPPSGPVINPAPFGVTFTGRAFSEPTLIALAYAYEQATKHRRSPASAPPLPSDSVRRP